MKLSVLYVDDEEDSYLTWGRPLATRFHWHAAYAKNVTRASEMLKEAGVDYDAVVLDRLMPDPKREGLEQESAGDNLLREIATRYPYCCVVMFTNIANVAAAQRDTRRGAYAFLTKGQNTVDDLDKALRNGVASKRVDQLYDRILIENHEVSVLEIVRELAEILRTLNSPNEGDTEVMHQGPEIRAYYLPISRGGSPSFPRGENLVLRPEWLPQDPARWSEILSDQRIVELSESELLGQWTATRDFVVRKQVLVPVRAGNSLVEYGAAGRTVTAVVCLESDQPDALGEEQIDVVERVSRAIGLVIDAQRLEEKAEAKGGQDAERDLYREFAHRVRNPLQTAQLTLESLIAQLKQNNLDVALAIERANRLEKSLQNAIEASLSFKDKSQPRVTTRDDVDVKQLLRDVIADFPEPSREAIHLDARQTIPSIEGEAGDLKYAFRCLIDNSLEAIGASRGQSTGPGHIEISIDPDPTGTRDVRISIADNGCGFSVESLERIFDRGFTTKDSLGGHAGLGLWEVKRIVHEHRGEIEVSPAPKGGAYFSILLPAKQTKATEDKFQVTANA